MKHTKTIKLYYTILLLVLGVKIVATIFSNGLSVHHGKKLAQLQVQKNNLLQQQLKLSSEFSHKASLAQISGEYDLSEYIPITKPLVLGSATTVASN